MSAESKMFRQAFQRGGGIIVAPGETKAGNFCQMMAVGGSVTLTTVVLEAEWTGTLNGTVLAAGEYFPGRFSSVTTDVASTGKLVCGFCG